MSNVLRVCVFVYPEEKIENYLVGLVFLIQFDFLISDMKPHSNHKSTGNKEPV